MNLELYGASCYYECSYTRSLTKSSTNPGMEGEPVRSTLVAMSADPITANVGREVYLSSSTLRDAASFLVQLDADAALILVSGPQASALTVSAGALRARTVAVSHTRPQVPQLCSRSHNLDRLRLNATKKPIVWLMTLSTTSVYRMGNSVLMSRNLVATD